MPRRFPHSRQYQSQNLVPPNLGSGREQRIDCRLAEIHHRTVVDCDDCHAVAALNLHVLAPGSQIDGPRVHFFTVACFPHRKFGDARKMLREHCGEGRRHVLRNQDGRALNHGIDLDDKAIERLRPSGRGSDDKDPWRRQRHLPQAKRRNLFGGRDNRRR